MSDSEPNPAGAISVPVGKVLETIGAAPEPEQNPAGEGSPDPNQAGAVKAVAGYENPLDRKVHEGSSASARTNFPLPSLRSRMNAVTME